MARKRTYVLEYDLVSPLGIGKTEVLRSLKNKVLAEGKISRFNTDGLPNNIAAEVKPDLHYLYSDEHERVRSAATYDRKFELLLASYKLMEKDLSRILKDIDPARKGIILGIGADVIPFEDLEHLLTDKTESAVLNVVNALNEHKGFINTLFNPYDLSAIVLANKQQLYAYQKSTLTACAASTQAIAAGTESIGKGETDAVLVGGADSIINALAFMSFGKLGVLAPMAEKGERTCKPFDVNRNGTLAGEAAGLCLLVSEDLVKEKGLKPKFEILGYGNSLDAYKITSPDPSGKGVVKAIRSALENANVSADQIDYINLHGTGTRSNDDAEVKALHEVFGSNCANIPISSTKDRHGHAIAAAGIQEFCIVCLAMEHNFIPCTVNLQKPFSAGLDHVMNDNRDKELEICMTSNFAFGGVNSVLIVKKITHGS
jgi:3-oxoacyl-[acyl-carrier-protein] synthase II